MVYRKLVSWSECGRASLRPSRLLCGNGTGDVTCCQFAGRIDSMKTSFVFALLFLTSSLVVADVGPELRTGDCPIGSLGFPIGTYLTLEGKRGDGIKTGVQTLLVDTINGKRLNNPVGIWIDNVDLPPKFRCRLKGYEGSERSAFHPPPFKRRKNLARISAFRRPFGKYNSTLWPFPMLFSRTQLW
jgi:hypothetical protein